jgi:Spy/CpxP family protein refolding chaperone
MKIAKLSLIAALVLGGLMACSTQATAQQDAPKKKKGMPTIEQQMERLNTELTLTDEQKPKVEALLKETQKKMQELRADTSVPRDQQREKMTAIRDDQTKAMKKILTTDQFPKYEKYLEQQRTRGGKKKSDAPAADAK